MLLEVDGADCLTAFFTLRFAIQNDGLIQKDLIQVAAAAARELSMSELDW